jgi:hypothetical protein
MACHPLARVSTRKDGLNIHRGTEYKVANGSS